jgi:hypothetical protein
MRWQPLLACASALLASGCHVFGGVKLTEISTATGKPSNVATVVSVTQKGQPVADLGAAAFRLSENGQELDHGAVDLRLLEPSSVAAFHTVLLIDLGHGTSDEKKRQLSRAAAGFVRRVRQKQTVTVLAFDGSPRVRLVGDFTVEATGSGPEQLENVMMMVPADPSRNLNGAVISALDTLDGRLEHSTRPVRVGTLVVFSRGPDVAGRVANSEFDDRVSHSEHQFVYVNVAGDKIDDRVAALTSRGKVEAQATDTLPIAFEDAAILANKLSTQYYLLSYCSPARAGERNLRVEVQVNTDDGKTESDAFETRFDSSGFLPACNSANPPRFSISQRSTSDRAAAASKPSPSTTSTPDAGAPGNPDSEPSPSVDGLDDTGSDVEVPPPKKRGYAP